MSVTIRRLGVIGDLHGEDRRLARALDWFASQALDALVCTGDLADGTGCLDTCCRLLQQAGVITVAEREAGILAAFESADADKNGALTAFEQQAWAESLPTHDDSLANPVRFDPNLDRRVSFEEFRAVIRSVAEDYASTGDGSVLVSDLEEEPDRGIFGQGGPGGPGGPPPGENAPTERDRS
jgi:Icc-related predicted phosphoesterase